MYWDNTACVRTHPFLSLALWWRSCFYHIFIYIACQPPTASCPILQEEKFYPQAHIWNNNFLTCLKIHICIRIQKDQWAYSGGMCLCWCSVSCQVFLILPHAWDTGNVMAQVNTVTLEAKLWLPAMNWTRLIISYAFCKGYFQNRSMLDKGRWEKLHICKDVLQVLHFFVTKDIVLASPSWVANQ